MSKHIHTFIASLLFVLAVLVTVLFYKINEAFVFNGSPPLLPASHILILYCTTITFLVTRNTENSIQKIPLHFIAYTVFSYLGLFINNAWIEMATSDASALLPMAVIVCSGFAIGFYFIIYWYIKTSIYDVIEDNTTELYIASSIALVFIMIGANYSHKDWLHKFYPKQSKKVIDCAIDNNDVNDCQKLNSMYYKWREKWEPGVEPEDYLYLFPETSVELCKRASIAVIKHDFKACNTESDYDKAKQLRQKLQSTENEREISLLEGQISQVESKYLHMGWECRRIYLSHFPDDEDDVKDFIKRDFRNFYDLNCAWQPYTCLPED